MNGVLLIDKPQGPTSHDVIARLRRSLGERRIGHTGTLDPMATGLLVLVVGKATRLASWLGRSDKTYEAVVRLGQATTTDDADGAPVGSTAITLPDDARVQEVLAGFRGTFPQRPPAHSARKVSGTRAYVLARQDRPVDLPAVDVTVHDLVWRNRSGPDVHIHVRATAGFYVRALARDLGERLGCGAHLSGLRRTRSGRFSVDDAWTLEAAEAAGRAAAERLIEPAEALPEFEAVDVSPAGLRRVQHGNVIGPEHLSSPPPDGRPGPVRILAEGRLVALARREGGALHPIVVLG